MKYKSALLALSLSVLCGCAPPMTAGEYCAMNGFKPGTKNYLSCLQYQQQAAIAQQERIDRGFEQMRQQQMQIMQNYSNGANALYQNQRHCVTRQVFDQLVTDCQ